jgi:hypothetical protein
MLSADQIAELADYDHNNPGIYWQVDNVGRPIRLAGAINFVAVHYPNAQGYNRYVYWPDYKVAGTIKDIVNTFRNAGINKVNVGTLYDMTNGQIGCYRKTVQISEEIVAACSFDPLNPSHQQVFEILKQRELASQGREYGLMIEQQPYSQVTNQLLNTGAYPGYVGGLPYQQQSSQKRQQIGSDISYLPAGYLPGFPGGSQYLQAQQRNVGTYGMRY